MKEVVCGELAEREAGQRVGAETGESELAGPVTGEGQRHEEVLTRPLSHALPVEQEVHLPRLPGARARRALCDGRVLGHGGCV